MLITTNYLASIRPTNSWGTFITCLRYRVQLILSLHKFGRILTCLTKCNTFYRPLNTCILIVWFTAISNLTTLWSSKKTERCQSCSLILRSLRSLARMRRKFELNYQDGKKSGGWRLQIQTLSRLYGRIYFAWSTEKWHNHICRRSLQCRGDICINGTKKVNLASPDLRLLQACQAHLRDDDYNFNEVWRDIRADKAPLCNAQFKQVILEMTGPRECT